MSHLTKIRTQIKDANVLIQVLSELSYRVQDSSGSPLYHESHITSQQIVAIGHNQKRIQFTRSEQDTFDIILDEWEHGLNGDQFRSSLESKVDEIESEIRRTYAYNKVLKEVQKAGFSLISEEKNTNGEIKLVVRRFR